MHSWRVLLLPYLDLGPLYRQYRFDEPWNGPNNRRLAGRMPETYRCPGDRLPRVEDDSRTRYVVVTGPETAFDGHRSTNLDDIRDGPANTLLLIETPGPGIHWMRPDDVAPTDLVRQFATVPAEDLRHRGGAHALFADGAVRSLSRDLPPETLRGLCTIDGGEPADGF